MSLFLKITRDVRRTKDNTFRLEFITSATGTAEGKTWGKPKPIHTTQPATKAIPVIRNFLEIFQY